MDTSEITRTLATLKSESKNISPADEDTAATINSLINKLEEQLSTPDIAHNKHSLIKDMRNAIEKFEYTHPKLTATVNDLMVKLSGIGV